MRNQLRILIGLGLCLCTALPAHAKDTIIETGWITLEGTVEDKCSVKVNNTLAPKLSATYGQPASFDISSECNRKSNHDIQISYGEPNGTGGGQLKHTDNAIKVVVPYSIYSSGGTPLPSDGKIRSVGMKSSNSMYVKFDPPADAPSGVYKGQVIITLVTGA